MITATFFSYKGGAGRSSTCFNIIPHLAKKLEATTARPIILIDTDVESAGMTYLLGADKFYRDKNNDDITKILQGDRIFDDSRRGDSIVNHSLYPLFVPVGHKFGLENNQSVIFLGVDDRSPLDRGKVAVAIIQALRKLIMFARNNKAKAFIMDSAAGDQTTARESVNSADKLVLCMRPSMQFRNGTYSYLDRKRNVLREKEVILLPTVVPADTLIDGEWQIEKVYNNLITTLNDRFADININRSFISQGCLGICEINRFKWQEGVLFKIANEQQLSDDEAIVNERYKKLAEILSKEEY